MTFQPKKCASDSDREQLDFLDILLTARDADGQGLTAQEIQDEVDTFTFEGMEPLSDTL